MCTLHEHVIVCIFSFNKCINEEPFYEVQSNYIVMYHGNVFWSVCDLCTVFCVQIVHDYRPKQ